MVKITVLESYREALTVSAGEIAHDDRRNVVPFYRAAGAAYDRICENPGLGRPLGGVMFSHALHGFPFAVIYEVTNTELCFLYLAGR